MNWGFYLLGIDYSYLCCIICSRVLINSLPPTQVDTVMASPHPSDAECRLGIPPLPGSPGL